MRPCKYFFYILAGRKCDLDEVEKSVLKGVDWPFENIFCLRAGPTCDMGQVE
jgi:hypothetical protein